MQTIKGTTKKGKEFIHDYYYSRAFNIYNAYDKPSTDKTRAWEWCVKTALQERGKGIRIMSYNTFKFTCGWMTANGLRVETADNSYIVELSNEQFAYLW